MTPFGRGISDVSISGRNRMNYIVQPAGAVDGTDAATSNGGPVEVGGVGPGYTAANRDRLGWIPANRKFDYQGVPQTVTLSRLSLPDATNFLTASIPLPNGQSDVVVYRTKVGADAQTWVRGIPQVDRDILPNESVTIHRLAPGADPPIVTVAEHPADAPTGEGSL